MNEQVTLDTPITQQERTPSLAVGRYNGVIKNVEISDVQITEDESKVRVVWTFSAPAGEVRGYSGTSATPDSKLFAIMTNLQSFGQPLKSLIGRKVGFTVSLSKTQKSKVDLATVTPI